MRVLGFALAALLASASVGLAAPVSIANSSFEANSGYGQPINWNSGESLGWTGASTNLEVKVDASFTGKDGANYLAINVDGGPTVSATTSTNSVWTNSLGTYQAGTTYTMIVALATTAVTANRSATIALRADGAVVQSNVLLFTALPSAAFQDFSVSLDTQAMPAVLGKALSVSITHSVSNEEYGKSVAVDNVRLDSSAVPEPGVLTLLASAGLLAMRRRR